MHDSSNNTSNRHDYSFYYSQFHDESDEHANKMADSVASYLIKHASLDRKDTALDIGCGMGFAMIALKQIGFQKVVGIDLDSSQIASARRKGLDVELVDDSEKWLRNCNQEFDTILLMDVLEHVPVGNQINLLQAVFSRLDTGGELLLQVPNANSPAASRWRYNDFTHHSSFTEYSLDYVLRNAGFTDIRILNLIHIRRPSFRFWKRDVRRNFSSILKQWGAQVLWRFILAGDLNSQDVAKLPLGVNLQAIATKV